MTAPAQSGRNAGGQSRKLLLVAAAIAVAAAALLGCATTASTPRVQRTAKYDEADYAPYEGRGTSRILGQAIARTRDGEVKFGAGVDVLLRPVTPYTTEWWNVEVLRGQHLSEGDYTSSRFSRETVADSEGRFAFDSLRAGEYYLYCPLKWEYVAHLGSVVYPAETGAVLGERVRVGEGAETRVVLRPLRGLPN